MTDSRILKIRFMKRFKELLTHKFKLAELLKYLVTKGGASCLLRSSFKLVRE